MQVSSLIGQVSKVLIIMAIRWMSDRRESILGGVICIDTLPGSDCDKVRLVVDLNVIGGVRCGTISWFLGRRPWARLE